VGDAICATIEDILKKPDRTSEPDKLKAQEIESSTDKVNIGTPMSQAIEV
jgi:hypothetical protein